MPLFGKQSASIDAASAVQAKARRPITPSADAPPRVSNRPTHALWGLAGVIAVLTLARLLPFVPIPVPVCGLRALTGIPCLLCGSTRCLRAWARLDPAQAFQFNPLVATALVGVVIWLFLSALDFYFDRDWSGMVWRGIERMYWRSILIGAALANWAYLIVYLPR